MASARLSHCRIEVPVRRRKNRCRGVAEKIPLFLLSHICNFQFFKESKRPASPMVMVDRGEIFSKGKMATK